MGWLIRNTIDHDASKFQIFQNNVDSVLLEEGVVISLRIWIYLGNLRGWFNPEAVGKSMSNSSFIARHLWHFSFVNTPT